MSVLIGYLIIGLLFFYPLLTRISTHILADDVFIRPGQSDAYGFLWTYWWIAKAIATGGSFLDCHWVLPPTGANLLFHTTSILPTILSYPLERFFGYVAGYNLMVISMILGAAWVYFGFLRKVFKFPFWPSFLSGAFFGFSPYFMFKAHAHVNLIGAVFWAGALAALLYFYLIGRRQLPSGLAFAVCVWATFWTSFVEFFVLVVVVTLIALVFETRAVAGHRFEIKSRVLFYLPVLLGSGSLLVLLTTPDTSVVGQPLFQNLSLMDLISFPRLSILASLGTSAIFEYWGTYLPLVFLIPAVFGLRQLYLSRNSVLGPLSILTVLLLVLSLDPFGLPSTVVRLLPLGEGFRVFGRFFPFFLFFFLICVAFALRALFALSRSPKKSILVGLLVILSLVELYPYRMQPSPVKKLDIPSQVSRLFDASRFVLVAPRGEYRNVHDTYQCALDMPCVYLSYLAREDDESRRLRQERFPIIYRGQRPTSLEEFRKEFEELDIGFVLFEDKTHSVSFPLAGDLIWESDTEALLRLHVGGRPRIESGAGCPRLPQR